MTGEHITRVMVDIETLGVEPGASIISIGAVEFGPDGLGEAYYDSVNLASCQRAGLEIDAETLDWWLSIDTEAREQLTGGHELDYVLSEFADWVAGADEVWANSPSFDLEILAYAFDAVGEDEPWKYYEERDFRTLKNLSMAPNGSGTGVDHNALSDAKAQAEVAAEVLRRSQLAADGGESDA